MVLGIEAESLPVTNLKYVFSSFVTIKNIDNNEIAIVFFVIIIILERLMLYRFPLTSRSKFNSLTGNNYILLTTARSIPLSAAIRNLDAKALFLLLLLKA
jgi:hypothetical protein